MSAIVLTAGTMQAGDAELDKLKHALQSPKEATRVEAIQKFKVSPNEAAKAAETLVPILADKSEPVRKVVVAAIRKLGPAAIPAVSKLLLEKDSRLLAIQILEGLSGDKSGAIKPLAQAAQAGEPLAAAALGKFGSSAGPSLIELLANQNVDVRVASLEALARIGPANKASLPSLRKVVQDPSPEVRAAAIRHLSKSIPPGLDITEFLEPLLFALADKDWQTRRSASLALGAVGPRSVEGLIGVLEKSQHPRARAEAILALSTIGPGAKAAVKPLIEVLRDPAHSHLHTQALAALAKMNPEAGVALGGLLNDPDASIRVMALNTLSSEQARTAKDALCKMLRDPSDEVRWASAKALARIGAGILPEVEPLLADPKVEVRTAALWAGGQFATIATLSKFLRDDEVAVQQAAALVLAKRGSETYPALSEALRSKNIRAERTAAITITLMSERADDLIPVLVDTLLAKETQAPEAAAQAILRVNPAYGARELALRADVPALIRLLKKAGFLEKEIPDVQELACLALAERGASAREALSVLADVLKSPKTDVNVLAAAARAIHAIEPKESAFRIAPDLFARIIHGTHEKSKVARDEGMSDLMRVGLKGETFESIIAMLAMDLGTDDANEWIIHHANASHSWQLAGPNLVRVLALFHSRSKLGPRRLTPAAEEALKAHLWRYLHSKGASIKPRLLTEVGAILPIDQLPGLATCYLVLDILKDDPDYKNQKIHGRTPQDYYREWTIWWTEWAKHRAMNGLWSELGLTNHQMFIWPVLMNMTDLASDKTLKQRFKMLLDLTMIEEEQISIQGARAGRRGKTNEVGSDLDPWKDILFGEHPRRFATTNINYRGIYWTTTYKLSPAAILLRRLNRPVSHYSITNHHFHGGSVSAFAGPHFLLSSQISQPKGSMEFPGVWHRLVFDDMNAILFPLSEGGRHHVQHKNVYITRTNVSEQPAIEFTSALKTVERNGWIFVSNGPAFAGIYLEGGYRLEKSGQKELGRQNLDLIYPKTARSFLVLQAGDAQSFGSFEKFQEAILKAPLKIAAGNSIHYMGPNVAAVEIFRDSGKAAIIDGVAQPLRSLTKCYDSPFLQADVGQSRINVRVGSYSAIYDFEKSTVTDSQDK